MKKIILFPVLVFVIVLTSCGPAAEERDQMMSRSKIFQDSIANMIRVSMAEAAAPGPARPAVPTASATSTAAPTPVTPTPGK